MKKMFAEFKSFISRGNVLDMAIGVIVAGAFSSITTVLVNNVLMPVIGLIFGGQDFTNVLNITVKPEISETVDGVTTVIQEASVIAFGDLVAAVINFVIIAFICFAIVKAFNKASELAARKKAAEEAAEEAPAEEEEPAPTAEELLAQILTELQKK